MVLFSLLFLITSLFANDTVFIKGGDFTIPQGKGFYTKQFHTKTIHLNNFYIDKYEFTYKELPARYRYLTPKYMIMEASEDDINQPVMNIKYKEALDICKSKGGDLPTEDEWIVAAAFENKHFYPYPTKKYPLDENDINVKNGNSDGYIMQSSVSVKKSLIGINGIYGMLGNVWEIVKSKGKYALVKGGSFYDSEYLDLLDVRVRNYVLKKDLKSRYTIGFRCVYRDQK